MTAFGGKVDSDDVSQCLLLTQSGHQPTLYDLRLGPFQRASMPRYNGPRALGERQ